MTEHNHEDDLKGCADPWIIIAVCLTIALVAVMVALL